MKTNVATTSIERYKVLVADGDVTRCQAAILCRMDEGREYTRAELSEITHLPINAICGRVFELVKDERLEECEARKCTVTGYTAKTVRLAALEGG